jgi:hypothetical protein
LRTAIGDGEDGETHETIVGANCEVSGGCPFDLNARSWL